QRKRAGATASGPTLWTRCERGRSGRRARKWSASVFRKKSSGAATDNRRDDIMRLTDYARAGVYAGIPQKVQDERLLSGRPAWQMSPIGALSAIWPEPPEWP